MRFLLLALLLILAQPVHAELQPMESCARMAPHGQPAATVDLTLLCRRGYLTGYDSARRSPLWVAERLDPSSAWGCGERYSSFLVDPDLPRTRRASTTDYARSGFDMGHMASAANHLSNAEAQRETFFLSNAVPQDHTLNAGLWFKLEVMVRVWAATRRDIQVMSGPVFDRDARTIGANRLPVPSGFWKVVIDPSTGESLSFLLPHAALPWRDDPGRYVVRLESVEAVTGLRFARPPGWAIRVEPSTPWPVDVTLADNLRGQYCP